MDAHIKLTEVLKTCDKQNQSGNGCLGCWAARPDRRVGDLCAVALILSQISKGYDNMMEEQS